jgi:hypothetical protein
MKNHLLFLLILFSSIAYGQVPNQINYQGIARNSVGNVLPNKNISVRLSIHDGSNTGFNRLPGIAAHSRPAILDCSTLPLEVPVQLR